MSALNTIINWLSNKKNWKTIIIPALVLLALFIAGRTVDIQKYLEIAQEWAWKLGPWGPIAFGAVYVTGMLLLLPGSPFTVTAALVFGPLWGYVIMITSTTVSAVLGFLVSRYLAKEKIEQRLNQLDGFHKIRGWVEKNHWLAISFIRIMPIFPFAMNNYALGLTNITFRSYLLISELVFIPMTAALIFGAQALYAAMVRGEISWGLMGGSIGAGLIVLILGIIGKKTFNSESS